MEMVGIHCPDDSISIRPIACGGSLLTSDKMCLKFFSHYPVVAVKLLITEEFLDPRTHKNSVFNFSLIGRGTSN